MYIYWASEASPTLTSTIEIEIPAHADIYSVLPRNFGRDHIFLQVTEITDLYTLYMCPEKCVALS